MAPAPSAKQLEQFDRAPSRRPVVLFYQYSANPGVHSDEWLAELVELAGQNRGRLIWAGDQEQAFVGTVGDHRHASQLHFRTRSDARKFFQSAEHASAAQKLSSLQVAVLSVQPRRIALISNLLAKLLPWMPFDNSVEAGEEPGVGTSGIMPTAAALAELKAHPQQNTPVVMINWLKFRREAAYAASTRLVSGRTAYFRYGKVALLATHSLKAKLLYAARYQQILIGNGGDPGVDLWDEFALMQYPGRATFALMASLKRYRRALHHREAGLTGKGQGLTISRPHAEFVWRA